MKIIPTALLALAIATPCSAQPIAVVKIEGLIDAHQLGGEIGVGAHITDYADVGASYQHIRGELYTFDGGLLDVGVRWHFAPHLALEFGAGGGFGNWHGVTPGIVDPAYVPPTPDPLHPAPPAPRLAPTSWSTTGTVWRISAGPVFDFGGGEFSLSARYEQVRSPDREGELFLVAGFKVPL